MRLRVHRLAVLVLLLLVLVGCTPAPTDRIRVMPLGDSITHGVCCNRPLDPSSAHPNVAGYEMMAEAWMRAARQAPTTGTVRR